MDPNDDLWTAIRRVLPDADALTAAVATELGEPAEDVRASVLIGTIAMNGQLGPEAAAVAAIEAELARRRPAGSASERRATREGRDAGRPARRDPGARGQGDARSRDDRGDPARVRGDRSANRSPVGRAAAPLRDHPTADVGALRRGHGRRPAGPAPPRSLRAVPPPVERADVACGDRWLPSRGTRHPREIGGGPARCAPGAPRRRPGRCGDRRPPATHGRAARSGPRSGVQPRRRRARARERSHPRAAGHRRGGAGGSRRTDRAPARCDRPGCRGRRCGDPAAGRPPAPRPNRDPGPRRLGRDQSCAEGARHGPGRPRGGCQRSGPEADGTRVGRPANPHG